MTWFSEVQDAFLFVSLAPHGMHSAFLRKGTRHILSRSEMGDIDEIGDGDLDWDTCMAIAHKNDLDLGPRPVFEFLETHLPDEYQNVQKIFQKQGGYGRFKHLLESKKLLENWYDFERQREEQALRQWCEDNDIELSG